MPIPPTSPETIWRVRNRNRTTSGAVVITRPAKTAPQSVWYSPKNPRHKADFYRNVGRQITKFPRIKALVGFDTPHNQKGMDSRVDSTPDALEAYRRLGDLPVFQVEHGSGTPGVFP